MQRTSGRITFLALLGGVLLLAGLMALLQRDSRSQLLGSVRADTATTTVTVLNTPPLWTVDAEEAFESSTSSPTNVGSQVSWTGTASDPNSDDFYLLICKTSSTPTPNASAAPTCAGGASNKWAVSTSTNSGSQATASYTASSSDPQINAWFAWVCDGNAGSPSCNTTFEQGTSTTASPFVVNHNPNFTVIANDAPKDPGAVLTWTATASDPDNFTGASDTVKLVVCKSNDFVTSTCGAAGTYCTSATTTANPTCNFTLENPKQDKNYNSFPYVLDNHLLAASGGAEATTSVYAVNNVAPTISSSSISLLNNNTSSANLTLTVPNGQTTGFQVTFTVTDNNSCQNAASGNEIASTILNVYRSGVGSSSCQTTGNYNPNNCYPGALPTSTWNWNCTQDAGSCSGPNDPTATFTCTFPLWYLADPTDGVNATDTQFFSQNWNTTVKAIDDNGATTTFVEAATGNELVSFMAYTLNTTSIDYGSLSPGSAVDPLSVTTTLSSLGNTGVDETLYGDHMCPNYPSCAASSTTSTIQVNNQKYASSSLSYASGIALALNPGATFLLDVNKTTATSTPQNKNTFWGLQVPSTITLAGGYTGKNTVIGVKSSALTW